MATFFSDSFHVSEELLNDYGAFNISIVNDLPLFIDPFLLFHSDIQEYQNLHTNIITYLKFIRDKASEGLASDGQLKSWYCFKEVKQNWFGYSKTGNGGTGLGIKFARALHSNLGKLLDNVGKEKISRGTHLEKVCLISNGVGHDHISDFATNLIKDYLCEYTQLFADKYIDKKYIKKCSVRKAKFNYQTEVWETVQYRLPWINGDFVLLTPKDILTKDDNWINREDLIGNFEEIPSTISDGELRASVENYFYKELSIINPTAPTAADKKAAAAKTVTEYPKIIDYFIRAKENKGDDAVSISDVNVKFAALVFNYQIRSLQKHLQEETSFYAKKYSTYEETHLRVAYLKDVIENKGGHKLFYSGGKPFEREADLQVLFRLVWFGTPADAGTEANDGRGPVDFKISMGAYDKTLVEMKLASNTQLKKNLQKQLPIYQSASDARHGIKVIMYFSLKQKERVDKILKDLNIETNKDVVLIDARNDNKPSGSKAA